MTYALVYLAVSFVMLLLLRRSEYRRGLQLKPLLSDLQFVPVLLPLLFAAFGFEVYSALKKLFQK